MNKISQLREWIIAQSNIQEHEILSNDVNLVDAGILNSLGIMLLINYVEELRGKSIDDEQLNFSHFMTIDGIVSNYLAK